MISSIYNNNCILILKVTIIPSLHTINRKVGFSDTYARSQFSGVFWSKIEFLSERHYYTLQNWSQTLMIGMLDVSTGVLKQAIKITDTPLHTPPPQQTNRNQ